MSFSVGLHGRRWVEKVSGWRTAALIRECTNRDDRFEHADSTELARNDSVDKTSCTSNVSTARLLPTSGSVDTGLTTLTTDGTTHRQSSPPR